MARRIQRQLQGCQHSSWYRSPRSSTQHSSVVGPSGSDCGAAEEAEHRAGTAAPAPRCFLLAGHSCGVGQNTHGMRASARWNTFLKAAMNAWEENPQTVCS